jgi:hypothetical protein
LEAEPGVRAARGGSCTGLTESTGSPVLVPGELAPAEGPPRLSNPGRVRDWGAGTRICHGKTVARVRDAHKHIVL